MPVVTYNGTSLGKLNVKITKQATYGQTKRRMLDVVRWDCQAVQINAAGAASLQTDLQAIEAALAVEGGDFLMADTHHQLLSAGTTNGVRIISGPNYPRRSNLGGGMNGEYSTFRSWGFVAEAEYLNIEENIVYFKESLRYIGTGGPDFVIQEPINGPCIPQTTTDATSFKVIQYGRAVGLVSQPIIPPSIAIGNLKPKLYDTSEFTPEGWGVLANTLYGARWAYVHEAATALSGVLGNPF